MAEVNSGVVNGVRRRGNIDANVKKQNAHTVQGSHPGKSILPTTNPPQEPKRQYVRCTSNGSVITWIRGNISSATETLVEETKDDKRPDGNNELAPELTDENVAVKSEREPVSPVSFPAFLNNDGYSTPKRFNYRRASLLDGVEQTMDITLSRRSLITLPLKETKRKLNIALQNLITSKPSKAKMTPRYSSADEECGSQSLLPIPIIYLPQVKSPATTSSLLNLVDVKESLGRSSKTEAYSGSKTVQSLFGLAVVFLAACALIGVVYNNFPEMSDEERAKVKLSKDIEDAKELGRVLSKYKDTHYFEVMSAFFVTYIFLQTFAIPGSVFLSILSGFMYPFYIALFLVCLCSGIGATGCYLISLFIGKPLVHKYLEERVRKWNEVVDGQREHLFNYLLFLRITPFLPNWFINIVSPVIEIPVSTFFIATFLGVAPLSFVAIQAGTTLYQLTAAGDAISWSGVCIMGALAVLSLLPVVLKKKLKGKFE